MVEEKAYLQGLKDWSTRL